MEKKETKNRFLERESRDRRMMRKNRVEEREIGDINGSYEFFYILHLT